jgi:hypothetical protein
METENEVGGRIEVMCILTRAEQVMCGYKQLTGWRGNVYCEVRNVVRSPVTIEQS